MQRGKGRCEIIEDGYTHTIQPRHAFSHSHLIGKIIDQSQACVEEQTEAGVRGEALSWQKVNLKDSPMRPRLSPDP